MQNPLLKDKIIKINSLLIKRYGIPGRNKKTPDPVDLLIATILSQNTNDRNSYRAFHNLKDNFNDWDELVKLPVTTIEKYIKVAGLGRQKSKAIKGFLTRLRKEKGKISLDYLYKMSDAEVLEELTGYNGIGVKTASCVLLFSMGRNICPVDTHVHRTANRIGLVDTKSPDRTFVILNQFLPEGIAHQFHTNLIKLGREICRPAKPDCAVCPLLEKCEYSHKNLDGTKNRAGSKFLLLDNIT
ncbi:MAG TPA: endonuclease III [Ignavibacteriaceae bacterium]